MSQPHINKEFGSFSFAIGDHQYSLKVPSLNVHADKGVLQTLEERFQAKERVQQESPRDDDLQIIRLRSKPLFPTDINIKTFLLFPTKPFQSYEEYRLHADLALFNSGIKELGGINQGNHDGKGNDARDLVFYEAPQMIHSVGIDRDNELASIGQSTLPDISRELGIATFAGTFEGRRAVREMYLGGTIRMIVCPSEKFAKAVEAYLTGNLAEGDEGWNVAQDALRGCLHEESEFSGQVAPTLKTPDLVNSY